MPCNQPFSLSSSLPLQFGVNRAYIKTADFGGLSHAYFMKNNNDKRGFDRWLSNLQCRGCQGDKEKAPIDLIATWEKLEKLGKKRARSRAPRCPIYRSLLRNYIAREMDESRASSCKHMKTKTLPTSLNKITYRAIEPSALVDADEETRRDSLDVDSSKADCFLL